MRYDKVSSAATGISKALVSTLSVWANRKSMLRSNFFCSRDGNPSELFDSTRKQAWGSSYGIYGAIKLDKRCELAFSNSSYQSFQSSWTQRPIRVTVVYTCAILRHLRLTVERITLMECKRMTVFNDVGTVIFLKEEDSSICFVSETSWKYRQPSRSGTATPLSRKRVIMYSTIWASFFGYIWTANNAWVPVEFVPCQLQPARHR